MKEILVKEGDLTQPGQVVVRMDTATLESELAEANANVAAAKERVASANSAVVRQKSLVEFAKVEEDRYCRLVATNAASQQDYDARKTTLDAAVATLAELDAKMKTAEQEVKVNFTPDGARCILGAFTSSMLTFVVFVVSSLLIVVQLASAQLTPRIIALVFADRRLKWVLSIFTFAYTYTIAASARIEDTTPQSPVAFAIFCNLACIVIFFWFVQWMGGALRPIAVLQSIANEGRAVVESVYPERFDPAEEQPGWFPAAESEASVVEHQGTSGVVLAFDQANLVAIAEVANVVIELVPQVGILWLGAIPCFGFATAVTPSMPTICEPVSLLVPSARWSRTRVSHFASWWTSPTRPSRRPSTIRRPPCWRWIRSTGS